MSKKELDRELVGLQQTLTDITLGEEILESRKKVVKMDISAIKEQIEFNKSLMSQTGVLLQAQKEDFLEMENWETKEDWSQIDMQEEDEIQEKMVEVQRW